jgi:hypothetical protein
MYDEILALEIGSAIGFKAKWQLQYPHVLENQFHCSQPIVHLNKHEAHKRWLEYGGKNNP